MRVYSETIYLSLKQRIRQLYRQAGGIEGVASTTRLQKSQHSDFQSPDHMDKYTPIDCILDLEREIGAPLVTQFMARIHGFRLVPVEGAEGDLMEHVAGTSRESAETVATAIEAIRDGEIDAAEMEALEEQFQADADHAVKGLRLVRDARSEAGQRKVS